MSRMSQDEVLKRFITVHGSKYDYSKVNYKNANTKVEIVCNIHGSFWQTPSKHYGRKQGCPACAGGRKRMTNANFIDRSSIIHNNKYDYSLVTNAKSRNYVKIICPVHGVFTQRCDTHLEGKGCSKCGKSMIDLEEFISKAKEKYGEKYDYSKVVYKSMEDKVIIKCKIHGEFMQTPYKHLHSKYGCSKCGYKTTAAMKVKNTSEFITKAKTVHGDRYDYTNTKYTRAKNKVSITCPLHGEFIQLASAHLAGYGCKHCSSYGGGKSNIKAECTLYYFNIIGTNIYKVGITSQSIPNRYRLKSDRDKIRVVYTHKFTNGEQAFRVEQMILKKYSEFKYIGEKIMTSGNTEMFTKDILELDNLDSRTQQKRMLKQIDKKKDK